MSSWGEEAAGLGLANGINRDRNVFMQDLVPDATAGRGCAISCSKADAAGFNSASQWRKSLIFMVPAMLPGSGVTIVVAPYTELKRQLATRCIDAGLDCKHSPRFLAPGSTAESSFK
ncbi:hypothetical protein DL95DRAFT_416010 [Leptodontidium sp. 2 PMI_412]|nr:hypothetical protein DL95DRAFT_416010 [Leptodontidium sp. 2 PMI_412]